MKKVREYLIKMLFYVLAILAVLAFIAIVALTIYCYVTYGNTPIDEVPVWALWFMWR